VEGAIDFDFEITLLTVRAKDSNGQVQTYFCEPVGHRQEKGDYRESWQPQIMSEQALLNAQAVAQKVTDNIGGLGLFGVELFVKGDQVWFSEVSPRPHDTGMVTMVTQAQSEFDLHVRAILGLPVDTRLHQTGASAVILSPVAESAPVYSGLEQALADPDVTVRLFAKPQALVNRRMGVALAVDADVNQAVAKAVKAAQQIQIQR
jgi:phosphoribosylglycinamide formyltransferase 2